ncbi:hypothetical protein SAMN02745166_05099 [Prosthecobacter debontii]|uniref:DUF1826 domain-containing protein n=1 Tax=Prosthecobacter debontii TaxID=48467 RepID=A0A1T4Z523_9BACT|nr:hypothetical protein [Prosthecobacter debontii]SKB09150.1 hypothetical protein SAMN02745166_05099 [Prosthecobacter debontii]
MPATKPAVLFSYPRIQVVESFEELVTTRFENGVNALCWQRELAGDYAEIVAHLKGSLGHGITTLDEEMLMELSLSAAGQQAREILLADQRLLQNYELSPVLDFIQGYDHDREGVTLPTHVQSFHADSATVEADTYLCTYYGASSEGLPNEQAIRHVDIPKTRAALLRDYGGEEDAGFIDYLSDHFYDLHYAPLPGAQIYDFGVGALWRIAIQHPTGVVPPCIHRAPVTIPGEPRLLLIS